MLSGPVVGKAETCNKKAWFGKERRLSRLVANFWVRPTLSHLFLELFEATFALMSARFEGNFSDHRTCATDLMPLNPLKRKLLFGSLAESRLSLVVWTD